MEETEQDRAKKTRTVRTLSERAEQQAFLLRHSAEGAVRRARERVEKARVAHEDAVARLEAAEAELAGL